MSNIGKIIRVNALPPEEEREVNVIYQVAAPGSTTYTDYAIDSNGDLKTHTTTETKNYKAYVARLQVDSSFNLIATVLDNNLGSITWSKTGTAAYTGVLTGGQFVDSKTIVMMNMSFAPTYSTATTPAYSFSSDTEIRFSLTAASDLEIPLGMIEIRVYN
ncbi:hypothetical protein PFY12_10345 [Chryseobacterium camelliae]|uniref:Uncharacterized protein n=1 Tax=Chryseobacterium camelliae TaxID=1265445 RepID=A0ABY7QK96_9FLAO|nr:hypothetical protein [Chryseobacterium camelliae]WBV59457.1 hypothetical protein PFY12_10345 [Chryseobacterium camelliae]